MRRLPKRRWAPLGRQWLWPVPAVVIALMSVSALLTPLAGRSSSADTMSGMAAGTMATCFLPSAGFCDDFSEGPYKGSAVNRGGDLDPARWSFSRETEAENPSGMYDAFYPVTEQFCQTTLPGVLPDRDSFMCNGTNGTTTQYQGTEDMHWMTAANDGGNYLSIGARALQPFDFAGRTGTVSFMVDAVTQGPHSTWPSLVLSDQPVNLPHKSNPGVNSPPRNGLQIDWNAGCGQPATTGADGSATSDYPETAVGMVTTFRNSQESDLVIPWQSDAARCVATQADHPNLIQVQISQTSLDIWMADAIQNMQPGVPMTPPALKHVLHLDGSNGYALNMTRGYLSFEQAQYAADKFNNSQQRTYHWHAIGFDGPVLSADRDYEVPDALTPRGDGTVNIGYYVRGTTVSTCCTGNPLTTQPPFSLKGVDLTGATNAVVTFDWREDNTIAPNLQVRLNGNAWRPVAIPVLGGATSNALAAIPLSDLVSGTNTLEFNAPVAGTISNIDLALDPVGGSVTTSSTISASTTNSTAMSSSTSVTSIATSSASTATSTVTSQTHSTTASVSTTAAASSTTASSASATSTSSQRSTTSSSTTAASTTSSTNVPTLATSAKLSHYAQYPGGKVAIVATVQDLSGAFGNGLVQVQVIAPNGTPAFTQTAQVHNLGAGQTDSYQFAWTAASTPGMYTVSITVYGANGAPASVNKSAATIKVL